MSVRIFENTGPELKYEGNQAGLTRKPTSKSGDANNPFDYTLYCGCVVTEEGPRKGEKTCLGPLGRFTANADGMRTAYCPCCKKVTVVSKDGQILHHVDFAMLRTG